jgi:2-dehydropantoate 2-reductase
VNWLVFGAGAIGTYIGGSLIQHGHQVTFLEQGFVADKIRQTGLELQVGNELIQISTPRVATTIDAALAYAPYDAAIFALKSFDTQVAITQMTPFKDLLPPLICLQNGVENEEKLIQCLGKEKVIAGTVTSAVARQDAGRVILEKQRGIGLADTHPRSIVFAQALEKSGLRVALYSRPLDMKWSKMLTNLLVNATSAILELTPAEVIAHPALFQVEIRQLREALATMAVQGIKVVDLPGVPVRLLVLSITSLPSQLSRLLLKRSISRGRGTKMPSFYIDLHSGRGQSEVDYLNGAVVRAGKSFGIATPVNQVLNQTLLSLTNGSIAKNEFSHHPEALIHLINLASPDQPIK